MTKDKVGYLVPEFPGQTHIFFWRELMQLRKLGIEPGIVSTRRPAKALVSHSWAELAMQETAYLFPLNFAQMVGTVHQLAVCGPRAWWRCLSIALVCRRERRYAGFRLLTMILFGARLLRLARTHQWKHIHVHSCGDAANIALFSRLLGGIPYSLTLHGPLKDYGPNQAAKWSHASFAIVITNRLRQEVESTLPMHTRPELVVAPMGVDTERFRRSDDYRPWGGQGKLRIFSCGRLNPCKGHSTLIRAVAVLRDRGVDVRLDIAGAHDSSNGSYLQQMEALIHDLQLQEAVSLLGAVTEEAVQEHLEAAHVFALASLHEPLGVAYMEAMAMEVPVVGTLGGGVTELIEDGRDGVLVTPERPRELADAIQHIASNPELAREMGRLARKKILSQFHSSLSAKAIANRTGERNPLNNQLPPDPDIELTLPEDLAAV